MRIIEVGDQNPDVTVQAIDEPGKYGASHLYHIDVVGGAPTSGGMTTAIHFQEGPVKEVGNNGITGEALVAIVVDRLKGFQTSQCPCRENAIALTHLETALMWMNQRTRTRSQKGVEGTSINHE